MMSEEELRRKAAKLAENYSNDISSEDIFYVVMDNVIGGFTLHFSTARQISDTFSFLWNYQMMSKEELRRKAAKLAENYSNDISSEDIFYVVMDNVIGGFTLHFSTARQISDTFSFLWNYQMMSKEELRRKAAKLAENYSNDISSEDIFYVVMDNVIGGFTLHFSTARQISDTFSFLWNYQMMSKEELRRKAAKLAENYSNDISSEDIFYVVMDNVIGGFTLHLSTARQISDTFSFLWNYQMMSKEELRRKAAKLAENYSNDISSEDLVQKMNHMTMVLNANCGRIQ